MRGISTRIFIQFTHFSIFEIILLNKYFWETSELKIPNWEEEGEIFIQTAVSPQFRTDEWRNAVPTFCGRQGGIRAPQADIREEAELREGGQARCVFFSRNTGDYQFRREESGPEGGACDQRGIHVQRDLHMHQHENTQEFHIKVQIKHKFEFAAAWIHFPQNKGKGAGVPLRSDPMPRKWPRYRKAVDCEILNFKKVLPILHKHVPKDDAPSGSSGSPKAKGTCSKETTNDIANANNKENTGSFSYSNGESANKDGGTSTGRARWRGDSFGLHNTLCWWWFILNCLSNGMGFFNPILIQIYFSNIHVIIFI